MLSCYLANPTPNSLNFTKPHALIELVHHEKIKLSYFCKLNIPPKRFKEEFNRDIYQENEEK